MLPNNICICLRAFKHVHKIKPTHSLRIFPNNGVVHLNSDMSSPAGLGKRIAIVRTHPILGDQWIASGPNQTIAIHKLNARVPDFEANGLLCFDLMVGHKDSSPTNEHQGPVSLTVFCHRNSNPMEISFHAHFDSNKVIATKVCTWHDSCAVVAYTNICGDLWTSNGVTVSQRFQRIWMASKNR